MLEMSREMRNTQYILGLVNGMLHLLSLSSLFPPFFYFIYLHKQLLACELQHSLRSKLQMLTASLFAPLLI